MPPQLDVRRLAQADADFGAALHTALGLAPPASPGSYAPEASELLADAESRNLSVDSLHAAYVDSRLMSASLAVESPGGAALVFFPSEPGTVDARKATIATLAAQIQAARTRSVALLEILIPAALSDAAAILQEAGYRRLTRLVYMVRETSVQDPVRRTATDLTWITYSRQTEAQFLAVIELTYAQSLDCPELIGIRSIDQVLLGHKSAGVHDPQLWFVALRGGKGVGVILLSRIPRQQALEIVYMGVAQLSRRTGVAHALLRRAVEAARRQSARYLALAVDERNGPARRMYASWGFRPTAERDVWIATPMRTEG